MTGDWLWDRKISDSRAKRILREPDNKDFALLAALLLARKNEPKEVFKKYLNPPIFCEYWPAIKRRMRKDRWNEPRIIFWQAIYEKLAEKYRKKGIIFRARPIISGVPLYDGIGKQISNVRKELGLSQEELAKKIGVSQQLISRIEKGRENVSLSTLNTIAKALNRRVEVNFTLLPTVQFRVD